MYRGLDLRTRRCVAVKVADLRSEGECGVLREYAVLSAALAPLARRGVPEVVDFGYCDVSGMRAPEPPAGDNARFVVLVTSPFGVALDSRRWSRECLESFFEGAVSVLRAVHAAGVLHNDMRSANWIVHDGAPVLIDFGEARNNATCERARMEMGELVRMFHGLHLKGAPLSRADRQ